ncbi:tRNA/rRNA methyltransferase SpoU [Macrophomina phaseolina MS6]|uniref:tRNA/rRNA methyltransferase SpoU n=1 Tax=Macrophomina phaseolina (strain MS6) TaxID=1126212 RepID=K2QX87_MACPH|nr:tRNA/rRNA methyltransferase SpoU [Macrophomina phaseolina MS6]
MVAGTLPMSRPLFRKELEAYDKKIDKEGKKKRHAKYLARKEEEMNAAKLAADPAQREKALADAMAMEERQLRGHSERNGDAPVSIPYTTAASQFIYGASAVRAALLASRRKCYKLYLHDRAIRRTTPVLKAERNASAADMSEAKEAEADGTLDVLAAKVPGLDIKNVGDNFLQVMDKMSGGRPHNVHCLLSISLLRLTRLQGVILEASPLPTPPILALRPAVRSQPSFDFELDKQSREEQAINGTNKRLRYNSHGWRYPFILYLDGIVDPGNLGAIIRSAYYFGVDAVAVSTRATAPLDAVAIKASSGAAEAMPILTVQNPLSFLTRSALNGWRVYAADTPPPPVDNFNVTASHRRSALDPTNTSPLISFTRPNTLAVLQNHAPLLEHPAILMLGGESAGFRQSIKNKANYLVGIRGTKGLEIGVDSLNVSVAAALIMLEMLRKPKMPETLETQLQRERRRVTSRGSKLLIDDRVENDDLLF